jgi:hypothetical protein
MPKATGPIPLGVGFCLAFIIQRTQFVGDRQNTAEYLNPISRGKLAGTDDACMLLIAPAFVINNFASAHVISHEGVCVLCVSQSRLCCFLFSPRRPAEATDHAATSIAAAALDPPD